MTDDHPNDRRLYASLLLRDAASLGWRVAIGRDGKARLERKRKTARPLPFELRWRIKEYRREVMKLVYRGRLKKSRE